MPARITCLLAALLFAAPAAAFAAGVGPGSGRNARPTAGVLPLVGPRSQALNPALGRAVAEQGQQAVLGPLELRTRLSAQPDLADGLRRAREAIALAQEHELQMNRGAATRAAALAIRQLEQARAPLFEQQLVARAYVALARSQLLRPADPSAARTAFRQALAVAPDYRPATGQLPPKVVQLLEAQRRTHPPVRVPAAKDLAWLARRLALPRLVWLHVAAGGEVRMVAYHGGKTRTETGTVNPDLALAQVARLINRTLGGATVTRTDAPWPSPPPPPTQQPSASSSWYGTWWIWAIAGAVVAGTAIGVGLAVSQDADPASSGRYDFRFHF